ncbi:MAG: DNA repair exonuclease [Thermoguttaceae bacterium]|jgi:DNA repair exonuclease SbcCD nuclease subunit|nr:DNA repair exonuclease [Thermoguttaceae bacterium]
MTTRLLCTGDVHLGRRPTRLPDGVDPRDLGPAEAFRRFVDLALQRRVHAAVLTGDVVDAGNRFYEAYAVLQAGVRKLLDGGVPVFAVAGNHDHDVLARLADEVEGFRLLGRDGQWEEAEVPGTEGDPVRLVGWSFPARHVHGNPLDLGFPAVASGGLTVGLLHCDCDVGASTYAPVSLAELRARPVAAWLLGHIHRPTLLSENLPLVLYPGSPQGLDPGEPGPHGAWLVEFARGASPRAELVPLAPLRYEPLDVSLDGVHDSDGFDRAVLGALRSLHDAIGGESAATRWMACRMRLTGRTALHRMLPALTRPILADLRISQDSVEYFVEKVDDATRPDHSLDDLARSTDSVGLLARRLLALERRTPVELYDPLIRRGRAAIEAERKSSTYLALDDAMQPADDEQVRQVLLRAGFAMLDELMAQKEAAA